MILEKACWYLNSRVKQIHPSLQCSFKLASVTHSMSLSCVRARVVTKRRYLTTWEWEQGGGSVRATLFVSHLQNQGCVWTPDCFFSAHTEQKASRPWGDILWIWQKVYWIRFIDYAFQQSTVQKYFIMNDKEQHQILTCEKLKLALLVFWLPL